MKKKSNKALPIVVSVLAVLGIGAAVFFYLENQQIKNDPARLAEATKNAATNEAKELKNKVAKLMQLPSDEEPVVATVSDREKLQDQAFFKDAQDGDRILIFTEAKKAVIYREKDNRIINVGPIAVTSDAATKTAVSVVATTQASADATAAKLSSLASSLTISKGTTTVSQSKTQVYDASGGKHGELVTKLAELTGGEVISALPAGQTAPEGAQVVIIAAK